MISSSTSLLVLGLIAGASSAIAAPLAQRASGASIARNPRNGNYAYCIQARKSDQQDNLYPIEYEWMYDYNSVDACLEQGAVPLLSSM
jgi:hypothetical protein